jgi:hypothetical protein
MLVCGAAGQGQTVHLAPAALHLMEHMPVHILNSSTLFAASAKMPEEACAHVRIFNFFNFFFLTAGMLISTLPIPDVSEIQASRVQLKTLSCSWQVLFPSY